MRLPHRAHHRLLVRRTATRAAAPYAGCWFLVGLLACARRPRAEADGPRAARRSFALTVDGYSWQPLMGYFFALVLGSLDRAWTKAMWPKPHQARLWAVGCGGGPALPALPGVPLSPVDLGVHGR